MLQAGILVLFLAAIMSMLVVSTVSSFTYYQELMAVQRDKNETAYATNQIINNIKFINDKKMVPYGVDGAHYHQLPNWLTFNKNNAFGIPYMYCPYSTDNSITVNNTVLNNDTTSYDVETISNAETGSNSYVAASDPSPISGVLAFVVSFKENNDSYTCSDITYTGGKFQLPNPTKGRVSEILNDSLLASDLRAVSEFSIEAASDTLETTLSNWNATQPDKTLISLKSNDIFNIDNNLSLINSEYGRNPVIYINGEDSLNKSSIEHSSGGETNLHFENMTVVFKNVQFLDNFLLTFENVNLYIEESNIKRIYASNSKIKLNNVSFSGVNGNSNRPFEIVNSELNFMPNKTFNFTMSSGNAELIDSYNSEITANNATINLYTRGSVESFELRSSNINFVNTTINLTSNSGTPNSLFFADSSSKVSIYNGDINQDQSYSMINLLGQANFDTTNISMGDSSTNAFVINRGGKLELNNVNVQNDTNVSFEPIIGIRDLGGSYVGGDNNTIYAKTDCLNGDLFDKIESITVADDSISSVNGDFSVNPITVNDSVNFNIRDYFNKLNVICL